MLATLVKRLGIADRLRLAWKADIATASDRLRTKIADVSRETDSLAERVERLERLERDTQQIKEAFRLNEDQRALVASLDTLLDPARITAHVRRAIATAPLQTYPFPHIVVEGLLPDDVYALALQAIPPRVFFTDEDQIKQNMKVPMEFGPTVAARFWAFVDNVIAQQMIGPAIFEKFAEPLRTHYETLFGTAALDRARALPVSVSAGRLMLRRPGYHLNPHRDPKRAVVTSLLYFARPHDSEAHGTQIFRVTGDQEATFTETYYPEEHGGQCELVKLVPFRPNTALMFVNSGGAHGADIPADASRKIERYAFQFYIGPNAEDLEALIGALPSGRQAMWRSKRTQATP